MRFTSRSIIFLFILSMIAVFFFGFNAGKYISHVDKPLVEMPISANPALSVTPVLKNSSFSRAVIADCGVSFLLPSHFTKTTSASDEAAFTYQHESIMVDCDKKSVAAQQMALTAKNSSSSAIIAGQKARIFASDEASILIFQNKKKHNILIQISRSLEELIKDTLKLE